MGFDSGYRRQVMERWKKSSARAKKRVIEALQARPGVTLSQRLKDALAVIVSYEESPD